ncbi:MAG: OmpH family outer membrane protein, partial [Pseudomonadota bacterium]|nr:OmpH family outer membrane protein [Pseudomonadota bacterium]MEC9481549.1 OmpH family outer membrane protein [Pseudomonadota bacterium]
MKKYFVIVLMAILLTSYAEKVKAAEDILFINLQYIVGQSKAGSSLREQSEELNSEIINLRDEITKSLQEKGKKLEDERTLLSPEVFQERADELRKEAEEKQNELNVRLQKIQQAIQRASNSIDSVISPILTEIVNEKGAKMLLERQTLLFADPKLDVSAEVIKKLNRRLPKID